jgi:hypothetical protein
LFDFYGCETWRLALSEKYSFIVLENKVLRKFYVSKRDDVKTECGKLIMKSRRMGLAPYLALENGNVHRVLVRKHGEENKL